MVTRTHAVVIAGAGPTGMTLAAELALAGVDAVLVERRATAELVGSRAGGLHARSIEVFDQRGVADRFLSAGKAMQVATFGLVPIDISDFPTRHPYGLALWQNQIEQILAAWVGELGVPVLRGCEVTGFAQDDAGVTVALSDGQSLRAQHLVGCDGGRSLVRKTAGIDFPGWDPTLSHLLAEVHVRGEVPWGMRPDGLGGIGKLEGPNLARIMVTEPQVGAAGEPTLDDLRANLVRLYGSDFGVHDPIWLTRFTDLARQAAQYRAGRVLIAGDAAHIHYPAGGQGLNLGVQDAVNLGWKLAQVVKGTSSPALLDTYHAERHPIAARVVRLSLAQVAMKRTDAHVQALAEVVTDLLGVPEARKKYAGLMSGLELRYALGDGHPLVGRRMPDLEVGTNEGPRRVFTFLHRAQGVLFDFSGSAPREAPVRWVAATYDGPWNLPVVGAVPAPQAVLVRPDGYVAWAGSPGDSGLDEALTRWFRS